MSRTPFMAKLGDAARRFRGACDGNALMMFGFAVIPLIGMIGAGADYSRAASARTEMQAAIDSSVLMIARQANGKSASQITTMGSSYFTAMFKRPDASSLAVTTTYSTSGTLSVTMTASANLTTDFLGLLGITNMPIGATSTAVWGNTRLRVALVLDNTGSMSQNGKMSALKTATTNLLTQLQSAVTTAGDVYVSIIPFSGDVNVGTSVFNAAWLRTDVWGSTNGTCTNSSYSAATSVMMARNNGTGQANCVATKATWTKKNNVYSCSNPAYTTQSTCQNGYNAWTASVPTAASWSGCVTDRDQDYDTTADAPVTGLSATLFPLDGNDGYCPVQLMGLTYDWTALNNKVTAMTPNGATNQTVGLQWGFQSLVANSPLTVPAKDPAYDYQNVIILLTDGLNTVNRWSGNGSSISTAVDARMALACANAKAAGIRVITVQVDTGAVDGKSTILPACASSADDFTYLTSSSQIVATFSQIGQTLTALRIQK